MFPEKVSLPVFLFATAGNNIGSGSAVVVW